MKRKSRKIRSLGRIEQAEANIRSKDYVKMEILNRDPRRIIDRIKQSRYK